jgi:uncharacterized membrane protein
MRRLGRQDWKEAGGGADPLRWQSALMPTATLPVCAAALATYLDAAWRHRAMAAAEGGLAISLAFAAAVWLLRAATLPAACAGGLLAAVMALAPLAGPRSRAYSGLIPLFALLLLTFSATAFGKRRRLLLEDEDNRIVESHWEEDRRGRSAGQVTANLGMAGLASSALLLPRLSSARDRASLSTLAAAMFTAALAEAAADTVASELGEVLGGRPFLILTGERVQPGTDGAVSAAGTGAGLAAAWLVVAAAVLSLRLPGKAALACGCGALCGLFVDSLLGATAERGGWLNNDLVNFLSTCAAAAAAAALLLV